jgi:hypothetical protein
MSIVIAQCESATTHPLIIGMLTVARTNASARAAVRVSSAKRLALKTATPFS